MKIELEESDGDVEQFPATKLFLKELKSVSHSEDLMTPLMQAEIDLVVTDSRVAVACEDWARGDHYVGFGLGATVAEINNRLSARKAKREAKGTVLAGHVRHDWLRAVGYKPKGRWPFDGQLRLLTSDWSEGDNPRYFFLDMEVPKTVDAGEVAQSIVQRAARHWLNKLGSEVEDPAARERFEELAEAPILPPPSDRRLFTSYALPMTKYAHPEDALPPETMT